jgi:hypothetical protein
MRHLKEKREMNKGFGWGKLKERDKVEGLGVNERVILTFKNRASYIWDGRTATLQMFQFIYFFNEDKY